MANGERLNPPIKGTERGGPSMTEDRQPKVGDQLMGMAGGMEQGGPQQAMGLVMSAAEMLMQAAQLDPTVAPIMQNVIATLQSGLQAMGGGGGAAGMTPTGTPPKRRAKRPPEQKADSEQGEGIFGVGST